MTKADIVTQIRVWIKENDTTSEVTDSQIYGWVDAALKLWIIRVADICKMAGFESFETDTLTITSGVATLALTYSPIAILDAAVDFGGGYRTMKRMEGGYRANDPLILNANYNRPIYALVENKILTAPDESGTAIVRYISDLGTAFSAANATTPTNMISLAENGLACYVAGIYWEGQSNGEKEAERCYKMADRFLAKIPKGFSG